ncbi:hypothetical protein SBOR_4711 [Sclerotinia borealis F-4128]|uniref:DUF6590 domain-containing protein n=1 Tax=Sclerotinia borealis (strain F-4128) TaxID=1432307 RepID=W9CJT8_SCLBF|nr:hypothetical protein SBOR_4711 [Sclerotinia borealis F-4128]
MDHYKSKGKDLDHTTSWTKFIWDDRGYWYASRTGPTGVIEYEYSYPEPENRSATPRTPGSTGPNVASNQQSMYSSPVLTGNTAYTISQTSKFGSLDHDATPTSSYVSPAPISDYYNSTNSTGQNYGAAPTTNTSNTAWSPSYPSTNNASWTPARNVAPSSVEATTFALNSMSMTAPRYPPPEAFDFQMPSGTKHISRAPNSGNTETLDSRYEVYGGLRQDDFWQIGRVFIMLWIEPAAQSIVPEAYSEIRRFVVCRKVMEALFAGIPIHTYSNQATLKPNLPAPNLHTIIYTTPRCPNEYKYEAADGHWVYEVFTRDPIQVISEQKDKDDDLSLLSRLNYSKVYTVEHYVRVLNIGMVAKTSMASLALDSG